MARRLDHRPSWPRSLSSDRTVDADFYRWTGGGPAFLAFLRAELIPLIESRYPVSDQGRTILGHSLGADFAVQAILAEDSPFARCVAGSPAIFRMLEQEQVAAAVDRIAASGDEFPRKIYLGCGSLEGAGDHPGLDRDLSGHVWSSALSYGRSKHRGSG